MIAADTSTWIAFLQGDSGKDVQLLDKALEDRQVVMAPAVLTELLSDPKLPDDVVRNLTEIPLIEVQPGYWERAGALRAKAISKRRKARLGDTTRNIHITHSARTRVWGRKAKSPRKSPQFRLCP